MKVPFGKFARIILALGILFGGLAPVTPGQAGELATQRADLANAQAIMQGLTPEERVGQLFLVTFKGNQVNQTSQIYDLITKYHVGGVMLLAANDNFIGPDQTVQDLHRLVSELQTNNWNASRSDTPNSGAGNTQLPNYVPLFVGIQQDGDGPPGDQILAGLTQMPDLLAIGATWKPELANRVGQALGQELQAVGINLFLGPSLDINEHPYAEGSQDLGVETFSGDPYWVSEMGKSYITGLHTGSSRRIAVIVKHFPGGGGADRPPQNEVATVRTPLDRLKQTDLLPFFAVTGNSPTQEASADGLLVSHVRYTGLQGNIRPVTKPVSLDPSAMTQLLAMPALGAWHDNGGMIVSDDLGSRAVRRLYDPSMKSFDARQVARDAFLAGNDLLYVDNFTASGDADTYTTLGRTLQFFAQKYREDQAFQQRVDAAVTRILSVKSRMYPNFDLGTVLSSQEGLTNLGTPETQQVANDVAGQAVTLINPQTSDLDGIMPQPPDRADRVVFFTDTQTARQCSLCKEVDLLPVDGLQNAILKLYGPQVSGQVNSTRLSSYSFIDLENYLNGFAGLQTLEDDLHSANWVVFSMLNESKDRPASGALKRLLSERPDLLDKSQKVIVFAFNAPDYLDATDIAKVTAYYGLYSKIPVFLDVAARVLFREQSPAGQLPISVPGAGYNLETVVSADPARVIPLAIDLPPGVLPTLGPLPTEAGTPEPVNGPTFRIGDTIPLITGVIRDHNNHPVPDGTPVHFIFIRNGDATTVQQMNAVTTQGVARAAFLIDRDGLLEIRVSSGAAQTSDILRLPILKGEPAGVTHEAPSPSPTNTPVPTLTPTATEIVEIMPTPIASSRPHFGDWLLSILLISSCASGIYFVGVGWGSMRWGVRWALCGILGGLGGFTYLAMGLPGAAEWVKNAGRLGVLGLTFMGVLLGWAAGVGWRSWLDQKVIHRAHR
ncbi:MAG: glycoside hydrolase family 3 N-terminal domain-containing protein [Anaerolineaceae bacterium]|nr:glycoside hydrolase family 3 N-terminal domain-containing protein [Anaerolineaceae bacterium]